MIENDVLDAAYAQTLTFVDGLAADDLRRPTPCADWDVRALLGHVVASTDGLVAMLRGEEPDWTRDGLGDDPAASVRRSLETAREAWQEPGAVDKPSTQMPGRRVVDFALGDAVAHAWDLSRALGRPLQLDDRLVEVVREIWSGEAAETGRRFGAFGAKVDVPDDAPPLDRLLGEIGRDPGWRPPA